MKNAISLLIFWAATIAPLYAQMGILSGKIVDAKTGETLVGVAVLLEGTAIGSTTDLDGNFRFKAEPGIFNLVISYLSYQKQIITNVKVEEGKVTELNFAMQAASQEIKEVVVEARKVVNTDASLISIQKKSFVIQDGISSQQLARTGSSNAAESIKQMPGANVEDGKYMVLRGLGDRYSISLINGLNMPSTDPYRNSSSLDIIPTSMIDNLISLKSFTPDMPGNFAGGVLNLTTKSFPSKLFINASASSSINTETTSRFFLTQQKRNTAQFFGFSGDSRKLNQSLKNQNVTDLMTSSTYLTVRNPVEGGDVKRALFDKTAHSFGNQFIPNNKTAPLAHNFNFSIGNTVQFLKRDLGFIVSLNQSRDFQNYNDAIINTFINQNLDELFPYQSLKEKQSVENSQLGGLLNLSYKINPNHVITLNTIFNNDAEIKTRIQEGGFTGQVSDTRSVFHVNASEFIQRQSTTQQLFTKHLFPKFNNAELSTSASFTDSKQKEPDLKYFAYTTITDSIPIFDADGAIVGRELKTAYQINNAEFQFPFQFFRNLQDKQYQFKIDFTLPLGSSGVNQLKAGGYYSRLEREFEEFRFQINNTPQIPEHLRFDSFNGDFESFFSTQNYGIIDTLFRPDGSVQRYVPGYYYINNTKNRNFYTGEQNISAAYLMGIINLADNFKVVGGARLEHTNMKAASRDTSLKEARINLLDLLPSLNLIYSINNKMNLRGSASQTIVRPNLREIAPFEQFDTKNGFFLIGNPNLKRTNIWNADIRWEFYPRSGEMIAISSYYKHFKNPIFKQYNPGATTPELQFINVNNALISGVELEIRKSLEFIMPRLKHFSIAGNFSYLYSRYKIPANEISNALFIDSTYSKRARTFQGQSPYIINLILSYDNDKHGLEYTLSFNVSGKKLYDIALFATPDIYENVRPSLNFKILKTISKHFSASFSAGNLLNPAHTRYQVHRNKKFITEKYQRGQTFTFGISYKL